MWTLLQLSVLSSELFWLQIFHACFAKDITFNRDNKNSAQHSKLSFCWVYLSLPSHVNFKCSPWLTRILCLLHAHMKSRINIKIKKAGLCSLCVLLKCLVPIAGKFGSNLINNICLFLFVLFHLVLVLQEFFVFCWLFWGFFCLFFLLSICFCNIRGRQIKQIT